MLSRYRKLNFFTNHMRHYSVSINFKAHKFLMKNKAPVPRFRFITSSSISIPVPWGSVEGKTWGKSDNAPILVAHGRHDNCETFDPLIPMLPQEYFYICFDLPGHGKSSPFPEGTPLKFFDYVLTLKRVVDYFSLKEVTCLGHSLGANASFYLAAIYPELVKKLIGLEIVTVGSVETHHITSWYREQFDQLLNIEKKLANKSPPSYSYTEAACRMKYNRWNSELTDEACSILLKRSLVSKDSDFYFSTDQRCKMNDWPVLNCDQQISVFKQIKCPILLVLADNTERNCWAKDPIFQPVYNYFKTEALNTSVIIVRGKTWGNNSNAPVLVVHGRLDNCGTFDPLIPLLPQEYFYVCIDFPGHGKSSPFPAGTPLKFFDFVLTMKRVVDYFNWKEVTCLGHSFGVQTSLYLAAIYPELVTKIIALEIGLGGIATSQFTLPYRERFDQLLSLEKKLANRSPPSYSYAEAATRVKKNRWMSELTDEACSILMKRSLVPNGNGFFFSTDQRFRLGVGPDLTSEQQLSIFKQVKCPVLLILGDITEREFWAKADIVKEIYNYFKTEALNILMVTVGGNHDVHLNHPERVSPHIRSFLLSNPSIQ